MSEAFSIPVDTDIPGDILDAIQDGFALTIPQDAATKGNPTQPSANENTNIATWAQELTVTDSELKGIEDDPESYNVVVTFAVAPDAQRSYGPDPNAGREFKQFFRLCPGAFTNKGHKKFGQTQFNLRRLKSFARALGIDVSGGLQTKLIFARQDDGALLIQDRIVSTVMKSSWYQNKRKTEVTDFIDTATASA